MCNTWITQSCPRATLFCSLRLLRSNNKAVKYFIVHDVLVVVVIVIVPTAAEAVVVVVERWRRRGGVTLCCTERGILLHSLLPS